MYAFSLHCLLTKSNITDSVLFLEIDLHPKEAGSCSIRLNSYSHAHCNTGLLVQQEDISPSTHNMDVPNVKRDEYQLVNIDEDFLNLMTSDGTPKDDVKVPEGDLGKEITEAFESGKDVLVTIVSAMGEEQAISWKEAPKGA